MRNSTTEPTVSAMNSEELVNERSTSATSMSTIGEITN
jgi:hypothetical protein